MIFLTFVKKKDLRHHTSVDLTLRFLTRFHSSHLHKFTEDALRQALLILAPESILYHAETMVNASLPLSTIYSSLFRHFGTAKSIKSLRQQLASIVDDPLNDPLIVLDSIKTLLRTSPESMLEFDSTCLLEATRYIQRIAGESIACNIDSILTNSRDISFLNFYEIVTTNFSKTLSDIGKARKRYTHHLHSDPPHDPYPPPRNAPDSPDSPAISLLDHRLQQMIQLLSDNQLHNVHSAPPALPPPPPRPSSPSLPCYFCLSTDHIPTSCPRPGAPFSPTAPCSIHGGHLTKDCRARLHLACPLPRHGYHTVQDCSALRNSPSPPRFDSNAARF